ncbi:hypothetical protein [Sinorhizobium sp. BJ1]|uniref:DUF6950 family protein n=1 Tax=Sinorhizobium sp. BJ1 TaxID=2035455 RepID=UPI0015CF4338|nr:hypothetical protein [Sinorhizobium sp. BJ1]
MAQLVAADELFADTLAAFLADNNTRPWQPGHVDCCMVLADWAMWLGHCDPAPHLRGVYDSDGGFRAIIAAHQGAVPLVASCAANIGGKRVQQPQRGDIGVIGSPINIHRQFGAIHDGSGWLVRMHGGFGRMTARTLAAWRI